MMLSSVMLLTTTSVRHSIESCCEARSKQIVVMLEEIRRYVIQRMVVKRNYVRKWKVDFGPNIIAKLETERSKSGKWQVDWNGATEYEVHWDDVLLLVRETYVVKLANNICSCGKWDKSGIPCQHAMAAIAFHGADPLNYISEWFKKETYLRAYQFNISPVKGRSFWPTSKESPMLSPMIKRMPGRPAKKGKKELLEGKNKSNTKLSNEGRMLRCGICHMEGHNRKSCLKKVTGVCLLHLL